MPTPALYPTLNPAITIRTALGPVLGHLSAITNLATAQSMQDMSCAWEAARPAMSQYLPPDQVGDPPDSFEKRLALVTQVRPFLSNALIARIDSATPAQLLDHIDVLKDMKSLRDVESLMTWKSGVVTTHAREYVLETAALVAVAAYEKLEKPKADTLLDIFLDEGVGVPFVFTLLYNLGRFIHVEETLDRLGVSPEEAAELRNVQSILELYALRPDLRTQIEYRVTRILLHCPRSMHKKMFKLRRGSISEASNVGVIGYLSFISDNKLEW